MRRIGATLLGTAGLVLAAAGPALAQASYPPAPPAGEIIVQDPGTGGLGTSELAFTGAEISLWMIIAAALIVVGALAVLLGRRRAAATR